MCFAYLLQLKFTFGFKQHVESILFLNIFNNKATNPFTQYPVIIS